jgi:hypothetical protein
MLHQPDLKEVVVGVSACQPQLQCIEQAPLNPPKPSKIAVNQRGVEQVQTDRTLKLRRSTERSGGRQIDRPAR